MTAAVPPDGRRDNGLPSAEWGALVDLDPRLSEALLDSLAAEGVPAYVEPASDIDSYTRAATLPSRPLHRLWVDPSRAELARGIVTSEVADLTALLAELEPGETAHGLVRPVPRTAAARVLAPPDLPELPVARPSDDEIFQQIIAGFSAETDDPVPRWPVAEDLGKPGADTDEPLRRRRSDRVEPVEPSDALPGWVEPAALPDDGHYEPPPGPKIPRPRPRVLVGLALIVLGFLALFDPALLSLDDGGLSVLTGLLFVGGGAGLLVMSMRDAPPTDSDPDDGAVV